MIFNYFKYIKYFKTNKIKFRQVLTIILIILTFYRSFFIFSIFCTISCLITFSKFGFQSFTAIFWFKLLSLMLTYYFISNYKNKEFYYYYNLGVTKLVLWSTTLVFDFLTFLSLIKLFSSLK